MLCCKTKSTLRSDLASCCYLKPSISLQVESASSECSSRWSKLRFLVIQQITSLFSRKCSSRYKFKRKTHLEPWIFMTMQWRNRGDTWHWDDSPAVDRDWSVLSKLLLCFMNLANEIDEALPGFGDALLWPISELELPYCPGLAVLQTQWKDSEKRWWGWTALKKQGESRLLLDKELSYPACVCLHIFFFRDLWPLRENP